ncbi:MAG: hypothetical protein ACW98I_06120 [Candidatus Hodarchaeales archaeon]
MSYPSKLINNGSNWLKIRGVRGVTVCSEASNSNGKQSFSGCQPSDSGCVIHPFQNNFQIVVC